MANLTQKALIQEFETMLDEMPFSKITVSALIGRCGVSSNTFYYHFHDIYDLLDTWLAAKRSEFLAQRAPEESWEVRLKAFFKMLEATPKTTQHLFDTLSRERLERYVFESSKPWFYRYIKAHFGDALPDEDFIHGLADCCCYSFYGLVLEFLRSNMTLDADAAIDRFQRIFDTLLSRASAR